MKKQTPIPVKVTADERNAKVLAVLKTAWAPMTPSEIASAIKEPWCFDEPCYPKTGTISAVCKRIGAVKADPNTFGFGKWFAPGRNPKDPKVTKKAK